jgi:hypothetical protein
VTQSQDDAIARAARLIAGALSELTTVGQENSALTAEVSRSRIAIESLSQQMEQQLTEERRQRGVLAEQITNLAGSLDRLVNHLEGISLLMSELVERMAEPRQTVSEAPPPPEPVEPLFQPGGEGISLGIGGVPGFQVLMDIQKALMGFQQVSSASVERFQEGDSRIQILLREPVTASQLATALSGATGHAFAVEDSRPELMRLRLKIVT